MSHTSIGWSTPYRIFHRGALVCLITTLLMLIIASIWQYFTLNSEKLKILHALFLTGQTYFTAFCFAPAVLVLLSLMIPRVEIEKFGAGRLRINIIILLVAVAVLSTGQIFRCVTTWIRPTPLLDAQGQPVAVPWYLHKACFYSFNFVTELIVVAMYALVRVDLRFYIPNGSKMAGDYSARNSRCTVNTIDSQRNLTQPAAMQMTQQNNSSETLHHYETSVFEDTHTLADSLRYGSSTLEVDQKTGNWKVKRVSTGSTSSRTSTPRNSLPDRNALLVDSDAPPVPEIPTQWPLPDAAPPRSSKPLLEHSNPSSTRGTPKRTFELEGHHFNDVYVGDAVTDALTKLEQNSEQNRLKGGPPPRYNYYPSPSPLAQKSERNKLKKVSTQQQQTPYPASPLQVYKPTLPSKSDKRYSEYEGDVKSPVVAKPPTPMIRKNRSSTEAAAVAAGATAALSSHPTTPQPQPKPSPSPSPSHAHSRSRSNGSLEIIALVRDASHDNQVLPCRLKDVSLQGEEASTVMEGGTTRPSSSQYSDGDGDGRSDGASEDARYARAAEHEFKRFSYESGCVVVPIRG
ncbi:hypothetical protein N0V83_000695 [Neocucurbitaria cava]|uniref:Uncharacterized protein n=1 Tax=Neocucurbitaria cava TaxID=798079 RepID=A0A9W8YJW2_9PLEO|nr:hypothetical protein N0V83_000695 [Neocucurbitaria cava]